MPKKALSDRVKSLANGKVKNSKIRAAVDAYSREQEKPDSLSSKGAHEIAKDFGIPNQWRTIINRFKGGWSVQEAHQDHQKLTAASVAQEEANGDAGEANQSTGDESSWASLAIPTAVQCGGFRSTTAMHFSVAIFTLHIVLKFCKNNFWDN